MISEQGRFIGIGVAQVDYVFSEKHQPYPSTRDQVLPFIETHTPKLIRPGSPMPNTFTAIARLSLHRELKLFHCLGDDDRGRLFQQQTDPRIGIAQIHPSESTGVWVGFNDEKGILRFGISHYGASLKVYVSESELAEQKNRVFVSDVSSCKNEEIHAQAEKCLRRVNIDGGIFVFSLGGARPTSIDINRLSSLIGALRYEPQIIFSNAEEFKYTTGTEYVERSILTHFPNTRLLIVTLGAEGSMIRFEDQLIKVPATPRVEIVDEVGAGDAYVGTMMGQLFNHPYKLWNSDLIRHAGYIAAFAASQIVTSPYARLGLEQAEAVLKYSTQLK